MLGMPRDVRANNVGDSGAALAPVVPTRTCASFEHRRGSAVQLPGVALTYSWIHVRSFGSTTPAGRKCIVREEAETQSASGFDYLCGAARVELPGWASRTSDSHER